MNITFIGNCQILSLCFYFQQLLLQENICYVLYDEIFKQDLGCWSMKCKNIILDYNETIQKIKDSDIIIYQNLSNRNTLSEITKKSCKLIKIPYIYLHYDDFDNSIRELIERENKNNVNIKISNLFYKFKDNNLMLTYKHPTTFLFMEIIKIICDLLNINFFTEEQYNHFIKNKNYMELS